MGDAGGGSLRGPGPHGRATARLSAGDLRGAGSRLPQHGSGQCRARQRGAARDPRHGHCRVHLRLPPARRRALADPHRPRFRRLRAREGPALDQPGDGGVRHLLSIGDADARRRHGARPAHGARAGRGRVRRLFLTLFEALFRVWFSFECEGEENVPEHGAAVVAANHPSYLDPILLSLRVKRPIRFMAWDALFRVPILGTLMRVFGAFPVDVRPGHGREAFERAKALIEQGEIVGLFPEGKRSRTGWMEPALREGAARLAWETGAPLVPATIAGAFRAWPHDQTLPRPARIKVRFHEAIDAAAWRERAEDEALPALIGELRRRVERTLLPGVKADRRMNLAYARPSPWPRWHEFLPALVAAVLVFWKTRSLMAVVPAYGYIGYLLLDH